MREDGKITETCKSASLAKNRELWVYWQMLPPPQISKRMVKQESQHSSSAFAYVHEYVLSPTHLCIHTDIHYTHTYRKFIISEDDHQVLCREEEHLGDPEGWVPKMVFLREGVRMLMFHSKARCRKDLVLPLGKVTSATQFHLSY